MPQVSRPLDERRTLWATSLQNQLASTHRRSRPRPLVPCKRSSRPSPQSKWPVKRTRPQRGHFSVLATRRRSHVVGMARCLLLTTRLVTAGTVELEARVRLSHVNKANRDEDTHNDADGKHPEHELCSPAPVHAVASHDLSMAERQILGDAVNVGWCENRRLSQRPAAFGAFALKQMAPACPVKQHFPASGDLETFRYAFPGFDSFGTTHTISPSSAERRVFSRAQRGLSARCSAFSSRSPAN
jgi:hypothetical protein